MRDWKHKLKADPTPWLLEPDCPPVRYWTLVDILDRPPADPAVLAAQARIPAYPPVAQLLASQRPDGYWGKRDFYLPRAGLGTFWVLSVLFGRPGEPNKWLTLDALRVVKLLVGRG